MASAPASPRTYAELRRGIEQALLIGQRDIERARLRTYWDTGRLIHEHLLLNQARATYGAQVMHRLARDLDVSERALYQYLQFARCYPILHRRAELGWAHYRVLIQLPDLGQRKTLELQAAKADWTSAELESRIRQLNIAAPSMGSGPPSEAPNPPTQKPLTPKLGTPALYPVVARDNSLALDLGFKLFHPLPPAEIRRLKLSAGHIVRVTPPSSDDDSTPLARADAATKADLFTYRARHIRVVDGDTLAVTIDLPPHNQIDKKLRLRGLNTPEMDTAAGKAAKRFVQHLVDAATEVVLTTTKPDKYDRYLADVFLSPPSGSQLSAPDSRLDGSGAVFLNNALLANGHALRTDAVPPEPL